MADQPIDLTKRTRGRRSLLSPEEQKERHNAYMREYARKNRAQNTEATKRARMRQRMARIPAEPLPVDHQVVDI